MYNFDLQDLQTAIIETVKKKKHTTANIITLQEPDINGIFFLNRIFEDNDGYGARSNRFCGESLLSGVIKDVDTILKVQTLGGKGRDF